MEDWDKNLILLIANDEDSDCSEEETDSEYNIEDESDEVEIIMLNSVREERNSIKKYVQDVVPNYSEKEFVTQFRIKRELFEKLSEQLEKNAIYLQLRPDKRCLATTNMLVFLWFAAHEACSFREVSDRFDISISSVCRIITQVTMFLSSLADHAFVWPNDAKMDETASYFERKTGFPKIIGAIDGTHIIIDPPKHEKDDYINRKGRMSIILQAICDENRKFIDIFVGYPGSVHDARVFKNSFVAPKLEALCKGKWIVGDSAYPLQCNLLTPCRDNGHMTTSQKLYNRKLSSCRVVIEHAFGILKQLFRQLYHCKLRGMTKICHFVRACCVLHNLANGDDLNFVEEIETGDENIRGPYTPAISCTAKAIRDSVCREMSND